MTYKPSYSLFTISYFVLIMWHESKSRNIRASQEPQQTTRHLGNIPYKISKGTSTQRMISSFSLDPHFLSFLHSAIREINWNREQINSLNREEWWNYIHTIHHRLTRPTSSRSRMNGWSSSRPHYIQLRLIIQAEQANHTRVDAP